jgi:tyrosyl-tRNA synthetase
MDVQAKVELVKKPPTEEVVTEKDLLSLFNIEERPKHYIGIEVSGALHLGTLIISGFKINDFIKAGIKCKVFLADWHSVINNKFGGNWEKIQKIAKDYYVEAFSFFCPSVEIEYGSRLYAGNDGYWKDLVTFCKHITLARDTRCLTILGRTTKDSLDLAQYFYPPMQATDIRAMDLDMVHSGMDQRKVHMLVREVFPLLRWKKPVAVHHHLLSGLDEPKNIGLDENEKLDRKISSKMSKSRPETAIFIHDKEEDILRKLSKAWCPEKIVEWNPVLDYAKHVIFHEVSSLTVERPSKYGGDVNYGSYEELEDDYALGKLHPFDLKKAVAVYLNKMIAPIRSHFEGKSILKELSEGS